MKRNRTIRVHVPPPRWAVGGLLAGVLLVTAACDTPPSQSERALDESVAEYEAGRYATAHNRATDVMRTSSGKTRDEAAYLAGLTAYRMGDLAKAEAALLEATQSTDRTTQANARATLGLVRLDQDRPGEAAELFTLAASGLTGEDHLHAARYATTAGGQADGSLPIAEPGVHANRAPAYTAPPARSQDAFALQVGAFQSRDRATRAASEIMPKLQRANMGAPRVLPKTDPRGRQLYAVQFGRFASRAQAASVRDRYGWRDCIVVESL